MLRPITNICQTMLNIKSQITSCTRTPLISMVLACMIIYLTKTSKWDISISNDFILKIRGDHWKGYRLEVDLHCPVELHDKFKELPPALETLTPDIEGLTPYQREIRADAGIIHNGLFHGTNNLVPHLYDHKKMSFTTRTLKYLVV